MSVEETATNEMLNGKVINIPQTDETLSKAGYSADAKITGDRLTELGNRIDEETGTKIQIDKTLTIEGQGADAKATGDKLTELENKIDAKPVTEIDETLSIEGQGADAKVTGDKFAEVESSINEKQNSLGFTPVQQGGGVGQSGNKIKIGWDNSSKLLYDIDNGAGEGTFASESWVTSQIQASIKATWEASY